MMKNAFKFVQLGQLALLAAAVLVAAPLAQAAEKPFSMAVGENESLVIFGPDGKQVATLPTATVGKTVEAPPYSFQVSYGKDANGNLSVIVTPNPDHPTPLSFTFNNREVSMDRSSVVTVTLADGGRNVIVDPGYTGQVKVDGKQTTVATNGNGTPATTANLAAVGNGNGNSNGSGTPGQATAATAQQPESTNGPAGAANAIDNLPVSGPPAPAINNNAQAVFSPVTNPADTTRV